MRSRSEPDGSRNDDVVIKAGGKMNLMEAGMMMERGGQPSKAGHRAILLKAGMMGGVVQSIQYEPDESRNGCEQHEPDRRGRFWCWQ